jgi:hypothetical protein
VIGALYGAGLRAGSARHYKVKAKNAQEAHEAIRPTSLARNPGSPAPGARPGAALRADLEADDRLADGGGADRAHDHRSGQRRWQDRPCAPPARWCCSTAIWRSTRRAATTPPATRRAAACRACRPRRGRGARSSAARADQHFTEPPPRYSEASLVKKMEELGIGRPSTYASILSVLRDRNYVRMEKNRFVPEDAGRLVTAFLEQFFARYVEYDFTAAWRRSSTWSRPASSTGRRCCANSGRTFRRRRARSANCAWPGSRGPERGARPAHLPGQGRRDRSARLPNLRVGPAVAEDRPLRRLRRLLELSGVPLHPPDRRDNAAEEQAETAIASSASIRPPAPRSG